MLSGPCACGAWHEIGEPLTNGAWDADELRELAEGRRRGFQLLETEFASAWPGGVCFRAIVRELENGADWAVSYRQRIDGRCEGHQQPRRVHAEQRTYRVWVED